MPINYKKELWITKFCIVVTLGLLAGVFHVIAARTHFAFVHGRSQSLAEVGLLSGAILFIAYGYFVYQFSLVGYYKRQQKNHLVGREELESLYMGAAPSLSVLVPSYKEERGVIWQTLLSAALTEYPKKNVVLLIDDPYYTEKEEDLVKLNEARQVPFRLQSFFNAPAELYGAELQEFRHRRDNGALAPVDELNRLALFYDAVAGWLKTLEDNVACGRAMEDLSHTDRFFIQSIIQEPMRQHQATADSLRRKIVAGEMPDAAFFERHYAHLYGLFNVRFSSFERKKYVNLSRQANKAMNLNSYIALMGKSWRAVESIDGWHLYESPPETADFSIPGADYVITLDADSMLLSDYALRLIHIMEQPENHNLAVIQSPISSFPGCPNGLERIAGATIDIQFPLHQGYTHWNATFWVGAAALLRTRALEDIKEIQQENGHTVAIYIQDRTIIEDTESTIDLIRKGWRLYNYAERLAYSANPPDFGSLLIQRRRWANGGLLILPKLWRYARHAPRKNLRLVKELCIRFYFLVSTTALCVITLLLLFYPFGRLLSTPWLPLLMLPYLILNMRILKNAGYEYVDILRIYAFYLMLLPVLMGGVCKQFEQMLTGRKTPFGRTPKVSNRTAAPALYCLIEIVIPVVLLILTGRYLMLHRWALAAIAFSNALFFLYALVRFMGVKETLQDLAASCRNIIRDIGAIRLPAWGN